MISNTIHTDLFCGTGVLKKRTIKLAKPLPHAVSDQFIKYINSLTGVHHLEINGNCITIIYDLLQVTEFQIEKTITDACTELDDDLLERVRRAYVRIIEETEIESLEAYPVSRGRHHH